MKRKTRQRGFTLLELLIVLAIVVLGFAAIGIHLASGNNATEVKAAANDIVSALRYARGQALMSRKDVTLTFNLENNSYWLSSRDHLYTLPQKIELTLVTAQNELSGNGTGAIRFFPDGSATGGRITLERENSVWQIDINWLTGQIESEQKDE